MTAFALGNDRAVWEVKDVVECDENMGSIDEMVTGEKVTVVGTTCYEQPEDEDVVEMTVGRDFISGLVGIDVDTGKELWRWEEQVGLFAADSIERKFSLHENGLLAVEYPYDRVAQVVDPITGDVTISDEGRVVWSSDDGSRVGLWDQRTRNYRIEDLDGEIYESLLGEEVDTADLYYRGRGNVVGLEDGALWVVEEIPSEAGKVEIAEFQGFENTTSISFTWNKEYVISPSEAHSVPGAVVIPYYSSKEASGIIGIR